MPMSLYRMYALGWPFLLLVLYIVNGALPQHHGPISCMLFLLLRSTRIALRNLTKLYDWEYKVTMAEACVVFHLIWTTLVHDIPTWLGARTYTLHTAIWCLMFIGWLLEYTVLEFLFVFVRARKTIRLLMKQEWIAPEHGIAILQTLNHVTELEINMLLYACQNTLLRWNAITRQWQRLPPHFEHQPIHPSLLFGLLCVFARNWSPFPQETIDALVHANMLQRDGSDNTVPRASLEVETDPIVLARPVIDALVRMSIVYCNTNV